jgi:pimeloyl-ACP methyl ester carboxylesterase
MTALTSGFAPVNGVHLYWESCGQAGTPLVLVHGGFGLISTSEALIRTLAVRRQVIAVELQGHGHTKDTLRAFSYDAFGDDLAGLLRHLGIQKADLLGYSLGAGSCLRAAIQHPGVVRRLAAVSMPYSHDGWFPEVRAAFEQMGRAGFEHLKHSPLYSGYARVAPDPDAFPVLMDKTGDLQRRAYDWSDEIQNIEAPTLLVYADADSVPTRHIAEFFELLGGGRCDAGWDGSARPPSQLAVLPGLTHYNIFQSASLASTVDVFFSEESP